MRAVPMATRDSRGCCKNTTRVAVSTGVNSAHQQAEAGRRQREQVRRAVGTAKGTGMAAR